MGTQPVAPCKPDVEGREKSEVTQVMAWPTGGMVGPFSGIGMLQKNRLGILDILDLGNLSHVPGDI